MSTTGAYLYRLRFHFPRFVPSAASHMIWASAAGWVFRQKPVPAYRGDRRIGLEVETLRHPILAKRALEEATGRDWQMELVWTRPACADDGEGPDIGQNPWKDGWPRRTD